MNAWLWDRAPPDAPEPPADSVALVTHLRAGRLLVLEGLHPRQVVPAPDWTELRTEPADELRYISGHLQYPA